MGLYAYVDTFKHQNKNLKASWQSRDDNDIDHDIHAYWANPPRIERIEGIERIERVKDVDMSCLVTVTECLF